MAISLLKRAVSRRPAPPQDRSVISEADLHKRSVRIPLRISQTLVFGFLVLAGLGPLVWLAKAAVSRPVTILSDPIGMLGDAGGTFDNLHWALFDAGIGRYLFNTFLSGVGSVAVTLFTCTTGAYVLSVVRPRWGPVLSVAITATIFIPYVVTLVPVYKVVTDLPITGGSLINTYWAIWLPAGANAFGVLVMKRFFDSIPRELFEAARVDGAGPIRVLVSIVLPLSHPIIGVLALLTFVNAYKDFLWPLLVLRRQDVQTVSVALTNLSVYADVAQIMAGLFIAILVPIVLFVTFQRKFLSGISTAAGIKG